MREENDSIHINIQDGKFSDDISQSFFKWFPYASSQNRTKTGYSYKIIFGSAKFLGHILAPVQRTDWNVLETPGVPIATSDMPPATKHAMFQAIAFILVYSNRDAVLGAAIMTVQKADVRVDWVAASGKNL